MYEPGQRVFVRQHNLSDASKHFSHKFASKFIPAIVLSRQGTVNCVCTDQLRKILGTYHAKNLKL